MFSKIIQNRIQNRQYWISDQAKNFSYNKRMSLGSADFEIFYEAGGIKLGKGEGLSDEQRAVLDLLVDFLSQYPTKQLESCQFREFDYFLRDSNSQSPFPEGYQTNHIESCFKELIFLLQQGPQNKIKLADLSKIQQILSLESFLKFHKVQFWDEQVSIELVDVQGKELFLKIQAPGDLELYLDKVQESLIEFFQDYELNCILSNNIMLGGTEL